MCVCGRPLDDHYTTKDEKCKGVFLLPVEDVMAAGSGVAAGEAARVSEDMYGGHSSNVQRGAEISPETVDGRCRMQCCCCRGIYRYELCGFFGL